MKRANLLSKAEMKKVQGGDPPGGICAPAVYCVDATGAILKTMYVGECDDVLVWGQCHDVPNVAIDMCYCDACN